MTEYALKTGLTAPGTASGDGAPVVFCRPGFRWDSADAYLFDIDGTLLNSHDAVHYEAFHHALREVHGVGLTIDGVPVHGNTDVGILRAVLEQAGISEGSWTARLPALLQVMRDSVVRNANSLRPMLCPGIGLFLDELNRRHKLLGVVSGNLEAIGWIKLQAAGLRHYFSLGSFSDQNELRDGIFSSAMEQVRSMLGSHAGICAVGDTPADIAAARSNRISVIAVSTGIYTPEELMAYAPDMCLRRFEGLTNL